MAKELYSGHSVLCVPCLVQDRLYYVSLLGLGDEVLCFNDNSQKYLSREIKLILNQNSV